MQTGNILHHQERHHTHTSRQQKKYYWHKVRGSKRQIEHTCMKYHGIEMLMDQICEKEQKRTHCRLTHNRLKIVTSKESHSAHQIASP
jgi:hypothetical protein